MKFLYWIGGIVAAGLLVGTGVRLIGHADDRAASPAAPLPLSAPGASAPAASVPAVTARADGGSTVNGVAQYQVGDHLKQSPSVMDQPYKPSGKMVDGFREVAWESLIPKDWDAMAPFKDLQLDQLDDNDPRAAAALWKAKKYWRDAPVDKSIEGSAIRIPGFIVSLDREGEALKQFLLVPYFGACIHVPPPPANQIIHVRSAKAVKNLRTMDAVWISGVLRIEHADTAMGAAGYSMTAVDVQPYTAPDNG
ncbi:DUF3299 domain-containing protein [Herbaspirillum sp. YR522]|uniref:DUF3299 domain-containing protein n=1 Tax=Herbaspirillum sp. YR522 TaxID=1144342 RepID=UPI00026F6DC4|nr:DUF3299 domain-containing protein [Herbaspirillum sp. YR522]EJN07022.1 hypothetical protein PMI40_02005 [Herbaspirillum sp. YR522]